MDGNPNLVELVATDNSPEASLEDFKSRLADDQIMYGMLRWTTTIDMSTAVKFVYIHW